IRNTFLNYSALIMFQEVVNFQGSKCSPILFGNQIEIKVTDSIKVVQDRDFIQRDITDEDYHYKFCYEQIVPSNLPKQLQYNYMLDDLNKFLAQKYKISGKWDICMDSCYALKLNSSGGIKRSESLNQTQKSVLNQWQTYIRYSGYPLKVLFRDFFRRNLRGENAKILDKVIVDNTNITYPIDL